MLEIEGEVEITVDTNLEVTAGNVDVAIVEDTNDIEVTVNRQEYVITGDEIYIPKRYEDAPTWMQNLINQVVDVSISAQIQDLNGISQSLESMIEAMEVAKNTYELSVISSNDIDERINTAVTTLNSSMNNADATILEVAQTRVTPDEASAITVDVITAELAKTEAGTLGATVSNLQTAIATEEEARSTSIEVLTSSIEGAFDANATAMNYINTYVGLDEVGASTGTGLSGYLEGSTGIVGEANSKVVNNVYVDALGNAKSKFEYGSTVSVNGVNHTAGFGLSNSTGTDIGSEFWINAAKFKFTNDNKTGSKAPFTIDATGSVPEITFNGLVTFNAVDSVYSSKLTTNTNTNNNAFAQRLGYLSYADMVAAAESGQTIINGGYLRGELIEANSINAGQINAYAITGKQITGGTISGTDINGVRITGAIIKASFIDYTSNLALSNWQYFTPSNVPPAYAANFAHNNDGSLLVDSQGYVRLPAQGGFKTTGTVKTLGGDRAVGGGSTNIPFSGIYNEAFNVYPWDYYTINTLNRTIYPQVNTTYLSGEFKIETYCTIRNYSYVQGIDGSHNYYDFYIKFLGDTIQGHAYINTNTSGTDSWRSWYVNGAGVGTSYSKTIKGITYTLSSEGYSHVYQNPNPGSWEPVYYGHGWKFTMTADFTGNKSITSYNFDDLIQVVRSEGSLYVSPDEPSKAYVCKFEHAVKYPVLNIL